MSLSTYLNKAFYILIIVTITYSVIGANNATAKKFYQAPVSSTNPNLNFNSGIQSIYQDSKGNYWFGSLDQGVAFFDGQKFTYFTTKEGLSGNQIRSIQEHEDGSIWFGTDQGVSSFDKQKMRQHQPSSRAFNSELIPFDHKVNFSEKDLWFNAGIKPGFYQLHNQSLSYQELPIPASASSSDTFIITDHAFSGNESVWMATYSAVFGYNGSVFTVIDDKSLEHTKPINVLHVRSVFEDSKGNLWIGNNGIGVLLRSKESIINFSEKLGLIHSKSKGSGDFSPAGTLEHVFAIEEDDFGNIWFGDRDSGVWKYDGFDMANFTTQHGLSSNSVRTVYKDNNGGVWVGLMNGSVYLFNGSSFVRKFSN
jgi:ligand-binding sensor domain-containing protein